MGYQDIEVLLCCNVYVFLHCLCGGNIPNEKSLHSATLACEHVNKPQTCCFGHTWLEMYHGAFTVHYKDVNYIKEITHASGRGLVLYCNTVVSYGKLLSGMPPTTAHTLTHTHAHSQLFFLSLGRVKSLFLDFWLVDQMCIWKRSFELLVFGPHYSARDLWCVLRSPICIKVLLIALISSDEWWLLLDWIFTINAFFIHTP